MTDAPGTQLPQYQCHKKVWALKIKSVDIEGGVIYFEDARYAHIAPGQSYLAKHRPEAGGYYVVYEGNYKSYSPAAAFESGYTLIS